MKIVLPTQNILIQQLTGIDPVWYEKLKMIEAVLNNGIVGQGLLATTATDGFAYLPTCAGAPTGVPVARTGYAPAVYDTTNHKLWIYSSAVWRGIVLT